MAKGKRRVWTLRWGEAFMWVGPASTPGNVDWVYIPEMAKLFESIRYALAFRDKNGLPNTWQPEERMIDIYEEHAGSPQIGADIEATTKGRFNG